MSDIIQKLINLSFNLFDIFYSYFVYFEYLVSNRRFMFLMKIIFFINEKKIIFKININTSFHEMLFCFKSIFCKTERLSTTYCHKLMTISWVSDFIRTLTEFSCSPQTSFIFTHFRKSTIQSPILNIFI